MTIRDSGLLFVAKLCVEAPEKIVLVANMLYACLRDAF